MASKNATYCNRKAKFGGIAVSDRDAQRLKELEQENNKLKLLAESMLDNAALKDLPSRK